MGIWQFDLVNVVRAVCFQLRNCDSPDTDGVDTGCRQLLLTIHVLCNRQKLVVLGSVYIKANVVLLIFCQADL